MNYDKYNDITFSTDLSEYKFISTGTKGDLGKLVQFKIMNEQHNIYNLALGTVQDDESIDFETVSKNGDRDKILATIATTAYIYSEAYPDRKIYLTGDTPQKTRLYQMAINKAYNEICETFTIIGLREVIQDGKQSYTNHTLKKGVNYDAFIFIRKFEEQKD